ncbi:hypothetical protein CVT25_008493 [Psilocybe cyanescens]|uniref:Uncharacterized protein n=1 Tax=Psilocybe cyanescens TaxID=93625 RepID=A0A409XRP0_PSICY|nr:hypothetical protein CVT25_008493 [Psilocybe cyanescens]
MFIRYLGGSVGHIATNNYTQHMHLEYHEDMPLEVDEVVEEGEVDKGEEDEDKDKDGGGSEDEEGEGEQRDDEDYNGEGGQEPWHAGNDKAEGYAEF